MEPARVIKPKPDLKTLREERLKVYDDRVQQTFQLDPQVSVTLKGSAYVLEFNNRAVKDVLKDCGFNALRDPLSMEVMENPEILGSLLHRGLQTHHPDLTIDAVDQLFTSRHYPYIVNRLRAAMDMFLPDLSDQPPLPEEESAEDPHPRPTPVG